jgi:hypothetical protein
MSGGRTEAAPHATPRLKVAGFYHPYPPPHLRGRGLISLADDILAWQRGASVARPRPDPKNNEPGESVGLPLNDRVGSGAEHLPATTSRAPLSRK